MRTFGKDAPEFLEFRLGDAKKVHKIPLMTSLPLDLGHRYAEIASESDEGARDKMAIDLQIEILNRYVGEDVAKSLSVRDMREIFEAWSEESEKAAGATVGE